MKDRKGVVVRVHEADAWMDVRPWDGEHIVVERVPFADLEPFAADYWWRPTS
jgi:hypothetical protein